MRLLLIFLFCISSLSGFPQSAEHNVAVDIELLKDFIHDLSDENISVDVILSQYIAVNNPSDEGYDYLEVSLEEIRLNVLYKNKDEIQYTNYIDMPRNAVSDIDPEGLDTKKMYFLNYRKRQMLAAYIENGKIASFTLVSKGNNKAHFVRY